MGVGNDSFIEGDQMIKAYGFLSLALLITTNTYATICPDPNTSSLQWGEVPAPWQRDPFSANNPQGESSAQFVRANIMMAGVGRGVVCTYKISVGNYSIWWPVLVKRPAAVDYNWIAALNGYVCTNSLAECSFSVAPL